MQDVTLDATQMIFYPTHLGLASKAFHQQKAVAINDFGTNPKRVEFVSAVDNPRGVKAIQNYLVGILRREDSSTNGLVQLFNSPNPILAYDRRRLESMARFFGGCLENIEASTKKLTTMLAVEGGGQPAAEAVEEYFKTPENGAAVADDGTFTELGKALAGADAELVRDLALGKEIIE